MDEVAISPVRRSLLAPRLRGLLILAAGLGAVAISARRAGPGAALAAAVAWWLLWLLHERRQCRRYASPELRERGIVFFAEAARWLCIRWSFVRVARGLRAGGVTAGIELFRWCSGWRGFLAIPALMSQGLMQRRGRRLAEKIVHYQTRYPDRPVDLIGYSSGAYVVLVALESLPDGVTVRMAILLAPTVRPDYDLTSALRHISGRMIALHSRGDWLINGIGPLLFGTADRRHAIAAGTVGFRNRPQGHLADRLMTVPYRTEFVRSGYLGDHFTVAGSGLARDHLAGWMIDPASPPVQVGTRPD
ncbi:MAG: DUF726 domain-containing protein [Phycisphaerae bacterium]|nr:DUF726 domain-containing protein [Phycisphaerae bacterium]